MKLNLGLLFVATQAAGVLSGSPGSAQDKGPLARAEQTCWYGEPYGCTDGYCWQNCYVNEDDEGTWCWAALDGGRGDWKPCSQASDCIASDCAIGDCGACGCGC